MTEPLQNQRAFPSQGDSSRALAEQGTTHRIDWKRAILAGIAGTIAFDLIGLLSNGKWSTPAMLAGKLDLPFAGGVLAHYGNGVILAIVFAGVGPSLWGPNWFRGLTYMLAEEIFGVWLFLTPLLGMGIAGLKAGPMTPVISLAKHLVFGLVVAFLYRVTESNTAGARLRTGPPLPHGHG